MRQRLIKRLDFRIGLAAIFAIWSGVNNMLFDVSGSMNPYTGFLVGFVVGMMIVSWWALAVAPIGFTLGIAAAHLIDVAVVPFVWSEWAVIVVLSLVFVVPGFYIGRWATGPPQRAGDPA